MPRRLTLVLPNVPPLVWVGVACLALLCGLVAGWQVIPFCLFLLYAVTGPLLSLHRSTRQSPSLV